MVLSTFRKFTFTSLCCLLVTTCALPNGHLSDRGRDAQSIFLRRASLPAKAWKGVCPTVVQKATCARECQSSSPDRWILMDRQRILPFACLSMFPACWLGTLNMGISAPRKEDKRSLGCGELAVWEVLPSCMLCAFSLLRLLQELMCLQLLAWSEITFPSHPAFPWWQVL